MNQYSSWLFSVYNYDYFINFIGVKTEQIDIALKNIPFLIIINEDAIDRNASEVCEKIRTDEDNKITPIIVVSSNSDRRHRLEVLSKSVEYYIKKPVDTEYLFDEFIDEVKKYKNANA